MTIPVVFATDDNYLLPLSVAIQSLKNHKTKDVELKVYIFYEKLSQDTKKLLLLLNDNFCKIEFINVSKFFADNKFYSAGYFTSAMYYRLAAPLILPEYEKLIYLDCDTLCLDSISNLYYIDLKDNYVAGVHDVVFQDILYINSGVLLFNSKEYIKNKVFEKCVKFLEENKNLGWPDQDTINFVCKDKKLLLPPNFNYLSSLVLYTSAHIREQKIYSIKEIKIIHFVSENKPWKFKNFPFSNLWWKESKKLPKTLKKQLYIKYKKDIDKRKFDDGAFRYCFGSKIYQLYNDFIIKLKNIIKKLLRRNK